MLAFVVGLPPCVFVGVPQRTLIDYARDRSLLGQSAYAKIVAHAFIRCAHARCQGYFYELDGQRLRSTSVRSSVSLRPPPPRMLVGPARHAHPALPLCDASRGWPNHATFGANCCAAEMAQRQRGSGWAPD